MPRVAAPLKHRVDKLRREIEKLNENVKYLHKLGLNREGIIVLLQAEVRLSKSNIRKILDALEGGLEETYFVPVKKGEELETSATVKYIEEVLDARK